MSSIDLLKAKSITDEYKLDVEKIDDKKLKNLKKFIENDYNCRYRNDQGALTLAELFSCMQCLFYWWDDAGVLNRKLKDLCVISVEVKEMTNKDHCVFLRNERIRKTDNLFQALILLKGMRYGKENKEGS